MKSKLRTSVIRRPKLWLGSLGGLCLLGTSLLAQAPPRPTPVIEDRPAANVREPFGSEFEQVEAVEHLTRGPLHEAFAEPYEADARPGPVVANQPPKAVNELPPDYRPDGENVVWITGYWAWDEDRSDFIWVSGVWRDVPPDHQWVPGYWSQTSGGFQYISGFWVSNQVAELEYLPPPPNSLEQGPSSPAPGDTHFYIPGHWVYSGHNYQWQPGYWSANQENWVWIPANYVWTPRGCVYQAGYWDYDVPYRGVVFTPVYYQQPVYRSPQYVYRPRYVVETGLGLFVHLFVRPNYGQYYFGDYYGSRYTNNYQPWTTYYQGSRYYDPFYTNYRARGQAANKFNALSWIANQHQVFVQNDRYRPATTIEAQRNFLNASGNANLDQTIFRLANLGDSLESLVSGRDSNFNFTQLNQRDLDSIVRSVAPLRELGNQRLQVESGQNANANARVSLTEARQQSLNANRAADVKADVNVNQERDALPPRGKDRGVRDGDKSRRPGQSRDTDSKDATDPSDSTASDRIDTRRRRSNPNATTPRDNDGNKPNSDRPSSDLPNLDTQHPGVQADAVPKLDAPKSPVQNRGEREGQRDKQAKLPEQPLRNLIPGASDPRTPADSKRPRGPQTPDALRTPGDNGAAPQIRPARPKSWPASPRRERDRSVPELPKSQSSAEPNSGKARDAAAERSKTPASPASVNPPASIAPNSGSQSAPKARDGNKRRGGENKGKDKKKDK